jgi:hypothetical protein
MGIASRHLVAEEWVSFPGGELEGRRSKAMCQVCREALARAANRLEDSQPRTLCFQCYRAGLDRERALKAAGDLDTASVERFQTSLPFEPVNRARLVMLKADRAAAREALRQGVGQFVDKRRQAQIAARHALQRIFAGVQARSASAPTAADEGIIAAATRAAELQLPDAWLPFVVSR